MITPTLARRAHPLASAAEQLQVLAQVPLPQRFETALRSAKPEGLKRSRLEILQVNLGKKCNQTCRHCHVDAGPERTEVMGDDVLTAVLRLMDQAEVGILDITGGAPELHPRFRWLVEQARQRGLRVMDRCNLTLLTTPSFQDLPAFFAEHAVEVVASLPHFAPRFTDAQRGEGVFEKSIQVLQQLNTLGYGQEGSGLVLNLVTNPVGAFLPGQQSSLEREWKRELKRRYGVSFNALFALTNMPISRYLEFLQNSGNLESYLKKLVQAFNPASLEGLMCRNTLSVGWDGRLFDCDFNQMLELALPQTIFDVELHRLEGQDIQVADHCFGCTAGAGSSCTGAVVV
ncbi:MAG: arsenosugar biosynthesis radical SAM (seleno)protein ArsS [Myxococcota bacterium]